MSWSSSAVRGASLALLAAVSSCRGNEAAERSSGAPVPVEAVVARTDTLTITVRSVGSLEAAADVDVKAEAEGRVARILFREGERVRRGQSVLVLDRAKLQAQLEEAEAVEARYAAETENLRRQVERNDGLLRAGAISQQAYDDLKTAYEASRARLEEARATAALERRRLADASVRAPFTGRTGERRVDVGDYVREGEPLFALVDDDSLRIGFSVPERYIGRLRRGSPVTLRVESFPDRAFRGTVDFVSPTVDPVNRTVRMKARVGNPDGLLRSGQFASVTLGLEHRPDALVLPEAAIVPRGGESFVFLIRAGQAYLQKVETGERVRGVVEVVRGVALGDTVVVAGQQKIREGSAVAPTLRAPPETEFTQDGAEN
ncbi:MAG: efflux RND transporter periplasmic adaptor subunit [Gemmatimonadota bacterium]